MGELIYIPTNSSVATNKVVWWKTDKFERALDYEHPYMLASAYYVMKQDKNDGGTIWDRLDLPDDFWLMGDSGGFQAATIKAKLDVSGLLKWQEENCNAAFIPDQPISSWERIGKKKVKRGREDWTTFEKAIKKTYNQTVDYWNARNWDIDMDVYNIILGYNVRQLEHSYKTLKSFNEDDGFTGWATGKKPTADPMLQALIAGFLYSKGHRKNVHFLGESGFDTVPVLAYAATMFDKVTLDSATYLRGSMDRGFHVPFYAKMRFYFGEAERRYGTHSSTIKGLPCFCPSCRTTTVEELRDDKAATSMNLHNLWWFIQYSKFLNVVKDDTLNLLDFTRKFSDKTTVKAIEFLIDVKENDFEIAYKRHYSKNAMKLEAWY